MVCIQRPEYGGGEIWFDGKLIRKDGALRAQGAPQAEPGVPAGRGLSSVSSLIDEYGFVDVNMKQESARHRSTPSSRRSRRPRPTCTSRARCPTTSSCAPLDPARYPRRPGVPPARLPLPDLSRLRADPPRATRCPGTRRAERYHEAARVIFANHVRQNVRYVETSFHLHVTEFIHVPGHGDHRGHPLRGARRASRCGCSPGCCARPTTGRCARRSTSCRLGRPGRASTSTAWRRCRPSPGPSRIWERIAQGRQGHQVPRRGIRRGRSGCARRSSSSGVKRVQHGVRAIEDPAVMKLAADRGVTFDICPLSNVGLRSYPAIASHPLRAPHAGRDQLHGQHRRPAQLREHGERGVRRPWRPRADSRGAELAQVARNGWAVADIPGRPSGRRGWPRSTGWSAA